MSAEKSVANTSGEVQTVIESSEYGVADLLIRPGTQQVFRDGQAIPLPRLSFDLLMALVRAAPNTVTQDELMRQVWPGLVISPETVIQRVKLLRDALGDDSQAPRYVGLVRGRGYRLLAAVAPVAPNHQGVQAGSDLAAASRWRWLAGLLAALVLLAVAAWWFAQYVHRPSASTATQHPAKSPADASIAVLPFATLSPDAQAHAFFAEGIHDELLTRLTQIDGLRVISRGSVLSYRDTDRSLRDIAGELGVATILEGSVQQVGNRVRLNVQLIDAASDTHLWAQSYDRELSVEGLLDIQADIAMTIASALRLQLQPRVVRALSEPAAANLPSYLQYLQGNELRRSWLESGDRNLLLMAEDHQRRAIALDPAFALAHAALGRVLAEIWWQGARPRSELLLEEARTAAQRALDLVPGLADAHLALAFYHYYGFRNYEAALAEAEIAEREMPGNADVHYLKSMLLRRLGRLDECTDAAQRLYELSAHDSLETLLLAGLKIRQGRLDEARSLLQQRLEWAPGDAGALRALATIEHLSTGSLEPLRDWAEHHGEGDPQGVWQIAWAADDPALARAALDRMPRDEPLGGDSPPADLNRALTLLRAGETEAGRAELLRMQRAVEASLAQPDPPDLHNLWMTLALVDSALGESSAALEAGERAMDILPLAKDRFLGPMLLVDLAMVYAQAGESQFALDALERALAEPFAPLPLYWQYDPRFDPLRSDPRFVALVAYHGAGGNRWRESSR